MQSAEQERGRACPSPSFYSEVRQDNYLKDEMGMNLLDRTREEEGDKEENDNLGQFDQTPHVSSTLGECLCKTLFVGSFISPGTLSQS